jgi:hypothetical protein
MPPRPTPGDREALEKALGPDLRRVLRLMEEVLELRPGGWGRTPLGPVFGTVAVVLEAARIQVAEGVSDPVALEQAAAQLGIPADTIRTRVRRWHRDSRRDECSL